MTSFFPQANEALLAFCNEKGKTNVDLTELYPVEQPRRTSERRVSVEDYVFVDKPCVGVPTPRWREWLV